MPIITRQALIAKNKAGNGIRQKENNDAVKQLADLLKKVGKEYEDEALELSCNAWSGALSNLANPGTSRNTSAVIDIALRDLKGVEETLTYRDSSTGRTTYDDIVRVLPNVGSSKEEFDRLLGITNTVLELGLEKSILDPKAQEEARREQERRRQEQERARLEREAQERERLERERLERERIERERREREREERERQERERRERERVEQERERVEQERQQRLQELKNERDALMNEDYTGTDYADKNVGNLKIEPDYKEKTDIINEAERIRDNDNILENQKKEVLDRAKEVIQPLGRRRQQKADEALLAEEQARHEQPIPQTRAVMISNELKESFLNRYDYNADIEARTGSGQKLNGADAILQALSEETEKLYIEIPGDPDHRCICLKGEGGRLMISAEPVSFQSDPELVTADPGPTLGSDFEDFYNKYGVGSAVDTKGNVLETKEDMLKALEGSGSRIMVFDKDKSFAISLENRGQVLFTSKKATAKAEDDFTVSPDRIPEKTTLLGIDQDDILYAEAPDGKRFEGPDAIRARLRDPGGEGRLYLYTKQDPENAYVVRHRRGEAVGISPYTVSKSQLAKTPDDTIKPADMSEIEEKRILNWKESDLDHAVDENGRRYDGPEAIKLALYGADKGMQIYTKGEELPFQVNKTKGRFHISNEPVPAFDEVPKLLGGQLSEMEADEFYTTRSVPTAGDFLTANWNAGDIELAVDEKGNRYFGNDNIARQLDDPGDKTLFVFDKSGRPPYAVQKKDGMLFKSDDRISTRCIMPDTESFEPKKSLDVNDIVNVADSSKLYELKDKASDLKKAKSYCEKNITRLQDASVKPKPPQKPVEPKLGFWNSIAYGFKWVFTFGRGDTAAHAAMPARRKQYREDLALYPMRKKEYDEKAKKHEEYLNGGAEKLKELRNRVKELNQQEIDLRKAQQDAQDEHNAAMAGNGVTEVGKYRNRTEARIEGLMDYRSKGVVTPDNIFAYTWIKEAECKGKPASDPKARQAFCELFAASNLERELLENRINSKTRSVTAEEAKLNQINSGRIVQSMMNDKDLQALFDKLGNAPIDPEALKDAYTEKVKQRTLEQKDDVKYLEDIKTHLNERFGRLHIDENNEAAFEKTFDTLMRYRKFEADIKGQRSLPPTTDPKSIEERFKTVKSYEGKNLRAAITEAEKYPFRKAFESMKGMDLDLGEMSKELDTRKRQLDMQAAGPQAQ